MMTIVAEGIVIYLMAMTGALAVLFAAALMVPGSP
jgi:hypothetical protein